jgi:Protein of unknown function (DUF975)
MNDKNQSDINSTIQNGYSVDIGSFIQRGWEICQSSLGLFIGFFLITILIGGALGMIPGAGNGVSIIIGGPLNAGSLIVAFKLIKAQPVAFDDFFKGFNKAYFMPTFLITLVTTLFGLICIVPAGIGIGLVVASAKTSSQQPSSPSSILLLVSMLLLFAGIIALVYISISYVFAIPLVIGKKLPFWSAMEASRKIVGKQWFSMFGFMVVLGLLNFAGALMCFIGLLITVPLTSCAIAAAYESIVGLPDTEDSFA